MFKFEILIGLRTNTGLDVPKKAVIGTVAQHFAAFSVGKLTGYWQGQKERSLCVTILAPDSESPKVEKLAAELRTEFMQDSVYITRFELQLTDVNAEFVPRETHNSRIKVK